MPEPADKPQAPLGGGFPTGPSRPAPPLHQPPRFLQRLGLLLIRPEQWAEAALYPYRYVFGPLLLIIVVVSLVLAFRIGDELVKVEQASVGQYDQYFNPMVLSHGTLKIIPIPGKENLRLNQPNYELRVDITGHKTIQNLHQPMGMLVTQNKLYTKVYSAAQTLPLSRIQRYFLLSSGDTAALHTPLPKLPDVTINAKTLTMLLAYLKPALLLAIALIFFGLSLVKFLGWSLIMTLLIAPGVMILNQHLAMPLRVAMRIGTAVMVPMVVVRAILEFSQFSSLVLAPAGRSAELYAMVWWLAPLPLGLWAGFLASRNLTRTKPRSR